MMFCNSNCKAAWYEESRVLKIKKHIVHSICEMCNKQFEGSGKYCSDECRAKGIAKHKTEVKKNHKDSAQKQKESKLKAEIQRKLCDPVTGKQLYDLPNMAFATLDEKLYALEQYPELYRHIDYGHLERLDKKLEEEGIDYAMYQKRKTLEMLKNVKW